MEKIVTAMLIVAMIGGLVSGIVCTIAVITATGSIVLAVSDQTIGLLKEMTVDCTQDIVTGETFRCTLNFERSGQEKEFNVNPVPGGDRVNS